ARGARWNSAGVYSPTERARRNIRRSIGSRPSASRPPPSPAGAGPPGSSESRRRANVPCYPPPRPRPARRRSRRVYFDFANILVFIVVGLGFILVNLVLAWALRPKGPQSGGKLAIYECGEPTIGQAWVRFDIRF